MKNDFININLRIDRKTYEFLKTCVSPSAPSVSFIVRRAIDVYFEKITDNAPVVPAIVEAAKIPPLSVPSSRNISPSSYDIMKAKRAKEAGRPYDKSLEPYFETLHGLVGEAE